MHVKGTALAALLLSLLLPAPAALAGPLDPKIIPALVLSAGRVDSSRDVDGKGTGFFLDGNYTRTFLNVGGGHKDFDGETVDNVYAGIGISKLVQLQVGFGTEGRVQRWRHDFNLTSIYDFVTGTQRNRYNMNLGNRITFTFAAEKYGRDERFNNVHIGFGLQY